MKKHETVTSHTDQQTNRVTDKIHSGSWVRYFYNKDMMEIYHKTEYEKSFIHKTRNT